MDYTLAVYNVRYMMQSLFDFTSFDQSPAIDILAYDLTVQRLIKLGDVIAPTS